MQNENPGAFVKVVSNDAFLQNATISKGDIKAI